MKIKILKSCSGHRFSFTQNTIVDVEKYIAEDLVSCGYAQKIPLVKKDTKNKMDGDVIADTN